MIKFISYSGKFPCLCHGVLEVKINGKNIKFGHDSENYDFKTNSYSDNNYDAFWRSGGLILNNRTSLYTTQSEWVLDDDVCNKYSKEIKEVLTELLKVFNENVQYGCCGGCI